MYTHYQDPDLIRKRVSGNICPRLPTFHNPMRISAAVSVNEEGSCMMTLAFKIL